MILKTEAETWNKGLKTTLIYESSLNFQQWYDKVNTWFHFLASWYQLMTLQPQNTDSFNLENYPDFEVTEQTLSNITIGHNSFQFLIEMEILEWIVYDHTCLEYNGLLDQTWKELLQSLFKPEEYDQICRLLHF